MYLRYWGLVLFLVAWLFLGVSGCDSADFFLAQATATLTDMPLPTATPFPTDTPTLTKTATRLPTATFTPVPTDTPTLTKTATRVRSATFAPRPATTRPPTLKPVAPTPKPVTPTPKPVVSQPPVSSMEFHVNPPTCSHSGLTFIKGTVYLDKNDPSKRYYRAIVALGPPDGSTIYTTVLSEYDGTFTFILGDPGQARPGYWGVWLVTPTMVRKSDIGGPIVTNNLGPENPKACWAGGVDFWK